MKIRSLMLAMLMFAAVAMNAQKGGDKNELRIIIQDLNHKMIGAILNDDYGKILTFYDAKAVSLPNYSRTLRGIDAIAEYQQQSAEMGNNVTALALNTKKIMQYGDALIEIGTYSITIERTGMEKPVSDVGKYLTVWVKHDDTYKIISEIWNTNVHPLEAVKGGVEKGDLPPGADKKSKLNTDDGQTRSGSGKKPVSDKKGN